MNMFPYRHRPYFLRDFYLDEKVARSLQGLLDCNSLNILIQGEPNTGKTSLLFALIREYYQLSALDTIPEKQVLFINNLKEQGITFFRNEIKSFCQMCSSIPNRKKIIVIDDLDIINVPCQQILCNYMDKYDIHFLFACCNVQKVIEGVQSRTFPFQLKPPQKKDMVDLYHKIVEKEGLLPFFLEKDQDAIREFLIFNANGNLRELINCLGKIIVYIGQDQIIDLKTCQELFLTRIYQSFTQYLTFLKQGELRKSIQIMNSILINGYSIVDIFDYFFKYIKTDALIHSNMFTETEIYEMIKITCSFIHIVHTTHEDNIELVLFTNRLFRMRET